MTRSSAARLVIGFAAAGVVVTLGLAVAIGLVARDQAIEVEKGQVAEIASITARGVVEPRVTDGLLRGDPEAVAAAPGPVVAHCRSGTRSLTLWAIGAVRDGRLKREEVLAFGAERGIDLAGTLRWLDAHPES